MGCDIHTHAEVRRGDRWERVSGAIWAPQWFDEPNADEPFGVRNYRVFERLAGVRSSGEVEPLAEPRGLPADVTPEVRADAEDWGGNAHSHSWLTLRELQQANLDDARFNADVETLATLGPPDDVRVVFWFDN